MLTSRVCRYEDFLSSWYRGWAVRLGFSSEHIHRKVWEWCAIAQALDERDMLRVGRVGCGFAVGKEPLPSLFASTGTKITATDAFPGDGSPGGWADTNQYASALDDIYMPKIVSENLFRENVEFRHADMRDPTTFPDRQYDFLWSSCAFEHLGSLEAGHRFVLDAANRLLKPRGLALHTTEFNVSSEDETVITGGSVIYRRKDIDALAASLRRIRCGMAPVDYDLGNTTPEDLNYDYPPYGTHGCLTIKFLLDDFVATSVLLIIRKG
jgi:SAM-dependent methyltransferase